MEGIRIVGHRGASAHRIQNTIPSFREALRQGATGLEMDIRRAASGQLVVFHDGNLGALAGRREPVEALGLDELRSVVLRDPRLEGQTASIPTLEEVVCDPVIKKHIGRGLVLGLEIKSRDIEQALVSSIRGWGLESNAIIYSFDPDQLVKARALAPSIPANLLSSGDIERDLATALARGIPIINPEPAQVTPDFVALARRKGLRVGIGCTNDYQQMLGLLDLDVWGIHTDSPRLLARAKKEKGLP